MRAREGSNASLRKDVILFRFHKELEVCRARLRIIRHFNPGTPIYGVFGGKKKDFARTRAALGGSVEHLLPAPFHVTPEWKWLHADLIIKDWFLKVGRRLSFDFLFDYEWDLLIAAPFAALYPKLSGDTVVFTGLTPLADVAHRWSWLREPHQGNADRYLRYMRKKYGVARQKNVFHQPACVFPRPFLEAYARQPHPPEIFAPIISELSMTGFAQALGFKQVDNGFNPDWRTLASVVRWNYRYFNCKGREIPRATILAELARKKGRRVFHPVRLPLELETLLQSGRAAKPEANFNRAVAR